MDIWTLSSDRYGYPNVGMTHTQGPQFQAGVSDVGTGQYFEVNPTAPYPTTLTWTMSDQEFSQFSQDWKTKGRWNWGAGWVQTEIPLGLDWKKIDPPNVADPVQGLMEVTHRVGITIGADSTYTGYSAPQNLGQITNGRIHGLTTRYVRINPSQNRFQLEFFELLQLPYTANASTIGVRFPNYTDTSRVDLAWNSANADYRVNLNSAGLGGMIPTWVDGEQVYVDIIYQAARFQPYNFIPTDVYSAQMNGFNTWNVTLPVEIDTTQEPWT